MQSRASRATATQAICQCKEVAGTRALLTLTCRVDRLSQSETAELARSRNSAYQVWISSYTTGVRDVEGLVRRRCFRISAVKQAVIFTSSVLNLVLLSWVH